jgi:hypothetical protein
MAVHLFLMRLPCPVAVEAVSITMALAAQVDQVVVEEHLQVQVVQQPQPEHFFMAMQEAQPMELVAVEAVVQVKLEQPVVPEMVEMELHQRLQER